MSVEYWLGEGFSNNDLIREGKVKKGGVGNKPTKKRPAPPKGQKKKKWEPNYWDTIGGPFNRTLLK